MTWAEQNHIGNFLGFGLNPQFWPNLQFHTRTWTFAVVSAFFETGSVKKHASRVSSTSPVCLSAGQGMMWFLSLTRLNLKAMTSSLMQAVNYMLLASVQRVRVKRWITERLCLPMHWRVELGRFLKVAVCSGGRLGVFVLWALMNMASKGVRWTKRTGNSCAISRKG